MIHYLRNRITEFFFSAAAVADAKGNSFKRPGYFASIFVTSLSVNIFIFPVVMFLFGSTGIFAVILNMAAVPVFYVALFTLLVASFTAIIWPPAGMVIFKAASVPLDILIKLSRAWKISGASVVTIDEFSPIYVILYYAVLCSLALAASRFLSKYNVQVRI